MDAEPIPHDALLQHASFLRRLARDLVGDATAADDMVQDVWVRALEHPPRRAANLRAWLRVVLTNVVRTDARSRSRRESRERDHASERAVDDLASGSEDEAVLRSVTEAVLALDDPLRDVVLQHYFHGLTTAEIAKRRSLPLSTVKSRLQRALEIMRLRIEREHRGDDRSWKVSLLAFSGSRLTPHSLSHVAPAASAGTKGLIMTLKVKVALGVAAIVAVTTLALVASRSAAPSDDQALVANRAQPLSAGVKNQVSSTNDGDRAALSPTDRHSDSSTAADSASHQDSHAADPETQRMTIHVVDREGLALPGVSLTTRSGDLVGTSASNGSIELQYKTRLDLASILPAFAEKRGYMTAVARLPPRGALDMTVELSAESPNCTFTVLNSARVPQPGACVVLAPRDRPSKTPLQTFQQVAEQAQRYGLLRDTDSTRLLAATTDESGIASLTAAPRGYALLVYAPAYLRHEEQLDLSRGEALPRKFTITLSPGRELRGRVVDEQSALPIQGVKVWHPSSGSDVVSTNDRGEFAAIVPEEPATKELVLFHPEYAPLLAEQSGYAVFAMKHGLTAHLRFVDSSGRPVTSDIVMEGTPRSYAADSNALFAYYRTVRVDVHGDADVGGVEPRYVRELSFHAPGLARTTVLVDPSAPMYAGERTVVTLANISVCRVLVLDAGARRVDGCQTSFTTITMIGGRKTSTSPSSMIEDEPGVYLLPSYFVSADTEVTVTVWKGRSSASKIVKASAQPFPAEVTVELQER